MRPIMRVVLVGPDQYRIIYLRYSIETLRATQTHAREIENEDHATDHRDSW